MPNFNEDMKTEVQILEEIKSKEYDGFSTILAHGMIDQGLSYIIMKKYGPSLKVMLRRSKFKRFSIKTAI